MYTIDEYLVLKGFGRDSIYSMYELSSLNYLGSFGHIESDPTGLKSSIYSGQYTQSDSGKIMLVNDGIANKLYFVNIEKSLRSSNTVIDKTINTSKHSLSSHLFELNDSTLIGNMGLSSLKKGRELVL